MAGHPLYLYGGRIPVDTCHRGRRVAPVYLYFIVVLAMQVIMKYLFATLLFVHGALHLLGFTNVFEGGALRAGYHPLPGLWLAAALFFFFSVVKYLRGKTGWMVLATTGILLSQTLIFFRWPEAKAGTLVNLVLFFAIAGNYGMMRFEMGYKKKVKELLEGHSASNCIVSEEDLEHLPETVRRYLRLAGVVGKPRPVWMRLVFDGQMREKGKAWFAFTSEQYNFFESPARLFFMKATIMGLPVYGYHRYDPHSVSMEVKLLGLLPVASHSGKFLYPTETVTFFNDLCMFAPAALLDRRISWEPCDQQTVKAVFTNGDTSISALLYFDEKGKLINFISNDRYEISEKKRFPYATPLSNYKYFGGYYLPGYGEAVWHYPEGEFVYGRFSLKQLSYNIGAAAKTLPK